MSARRRGSARPKPTYVVGVLLVTASLAACESSGSAAEPVSSPAQSEAPSLNPVAKAVQRASPQPCQLGPVTARVQSLVEALNNGHPEQVADSFTEPTHWEVYDYFGQGVLENRASIEAFVRQVSDQRNKWSMGRVIPPEGTAVLPERSVYGAELLIEANGTTRSSGSKIVIDCESGLIDRMVGPS